MWIYLTPFFLCILIIILFTFLIKRKFYSLGGKISDIRENVKRKRNELAAMRRIKALSTIVESQVRLLLGFSASFLCFSLFPFKICAL